MGNSPYVDAMTRDVALENVSHENVTPMYARGASEGAFRGLGTIAWIPNPVYVSAMPVNVSNAQRAVRALPRRRQAIELCQSGYSNKEIAQKLGCSESSVSRYVNEYWESQCRFPTDLSVDEAQFRRAQRRDDLEKLRQTLLREMAVLDQALNMAYGPGDRSQITTAKCRLSDSLVKVNEQLCLIDGLYAPRKMETKIQNNTAVFVTGGQMDELRSMAQAKVLSLEERQGTDG